jgi:biopolymer transport protein ExbD
VAGLCRYQGIQKENEKMKKEDMSCIDCAVKNCNKMDKTYPDFCLTTHMDEEVLNEAMECYNEDENRKVTIAAAEVEYENYCKHTRVEEIMDFAKKINAKKIGIISGGILGYEGALKQGDNLEDLFMNVVRKNQKAGEIHG